ncbi:MAG TPA: 16S rRNA (adenine(1518)-N(6)/adenine(1519)-N(6))-dimethyltransferase RsmA [Gemmatimonadales bacterium]|nr:16S rRNA (adenine(1518)-N(6)/adenine(1519)-N(6))-dimethyltransferase RsmA [Gemmatimonadales bacterium]
MRAKKRFGQHFLRRRAVLERIARALDPAPGDLVLEIGPGQGTLTEVLAASGARVVAIEKDRDLVPLLRARLPEVSVIEGDALDLDWREAAGARPGEPLLVAGNIPYNLTSPLLDKALEPPRPGRIVFLVQKEVADRLSARPGTRAYGALSVGVQAVARIEKLFTVPAGTFHPPPRVDSTVVRLTPERTTALRDDEVAGFRRLVVGLFGFRRKQMLRALRELTGWNPERAGERLGNAGILATVRPETLEPAAFVELLAEVVDGGWSPR